MLKEFLLKIANAIRSALGTTDTINAQNFPNKIAEVYEAGQKNEYDKFWDNYQDNGERTNYSNAFGIGFNNQTLRPKYLLTNAFNIDYMFRTCEFSGDLDALFKELGVLGSENILTITRGDTTQPFRDAQSITKYFGIKLSDTVSSMNYWYYNCYSLKEIPLISLPDSKIVTFNETFSGCSNLETVNFIGKIKSSIDFKDCKNLSRESIENIVDALYYPDNPEDWTLGTGDNAPTIIFSVAALENSYPYGMNDDLYDYGRCGNFHIDFWKYIRDKTTVKPGTAIGWKIKMYSIYSENYLEPNNYDGDSD